MAEVMARSPFVRALITHEAHRSQKGTHSAGVSRQYCGVMGKTDNCMAGVFVGYSGAKGYGLVDRRLYMPHNWFNEDHAQLRALWCSRRYHFCYQAAVGGRSGQPGNARVTWEWTIMKRGPRMPGTDICFLYSLLTSLSPRFGCGLKNTLSYHCLKPTA
ncbi:MAG: hypothetical protein D9V47_00320 [Clostridia bacterium]|nr:MAG: hypothetical protein D9V47_00320 [Clostridia bacterium]